MPLALTLEERVSHVEHELAMLKSQVDRLRPENNDTDPITAAAKSDVATVDLPRRANPWLTGVGMFRDDPLFDGWQRAIAECRREADSIADAP